MLREFFEVKVKYQKMASDGKEKVVSEPYLINAVSFTDTEASIHKELEPYIAGEFIVISEKISEFSEVIPSKDGDRWFKCKAAFVSIDEEKGTEKRSNTWILVQADTVHSAYVLLEHHLSDSMSDFEIPSISESPIVDVFIRTE